LLLPDNTAVNWHSYAQTVTVLLSSVTVNGYNLKAVVHLEERGLQPAQPDAPAGPAPPPPGDAPVSPGDPPTFAPDVNDPQSSETAIRTYRAGLTDHDVATLYSLIKEFQSLTMDSTTGAAAFTRRVLDLARRLAALGVPYPDPVLCCHLLEGLTPAFDTHKIAYMQLIDKRITPAEEVRTSPLFQPVSSPLAHQAVSQHQQQQQTPQQILPQPFQQQQQQFQQQQQQGQQHLFSHVTPFPSSGFVGMVSQAGTPAPSMYSAAINENGHRYMLVLVDDHSRYSSVSLLRSKGDASAAIIAWLKQASTHFGRPVRRLHSDGGGEFLNRQLWTSAKPDVSSLRVWGSRAYVLIHPADRPRTMGKLASRTLPCIFLGHNPSSPDYLFLHPPSVLGAPPPVILSSSPLPPLSPLMDLLFQTVLQQNTSPTLPSSSSTAAPPAAATAAAAVPPTAAAPAAAAVAPSSPSPAAAAVAAADAAVAAASAAVAAADAAVAAASAAAAADASSAAAAAAAAASAAAVLPFIFHSSLLEDSHEEILNLHLHDPALLPISPDLSGTPVFAFSSAPTIFVPATYEEAMACPDAHLWLAAILKELEAFIANSSFVDVPRPPSTTNVVKGKWVFRVKQLPGEPPVYKARYVAKGFTQRYAVDFFDTFSPTAKPATIRAVLDLAARLNMEIHSMDVSNAFLQGVLRELIYMERPAGFHLPFPSDSVWQLRRPVYGLKQAPREWHAKLAATLVELGFSTSRADPSLFLRTSPSPFYILVYVDDMILITADSAELERVKRELGSRLKCKDLGELQHYLGMEITRDRAARTISLSQGHYLQQVLERFDMARGTPQVTPLPVGHHLTPLTSPSSSSHPYAELIGSLMYAMVSTRPDLAYPISVLARFVGTGKHDAAHWQAAKRVLRYLRGTKDYVLTLGGPSPPLLTGYSDSSWADSRPDRRSSQGYGFSLGSGLISWRSTRSSSIALSSCEAELYAATMAAQEARWLSFLLEELVLCMLGVVL
ncbi:hypothetical protein CLOM_g14857, partial [Closterium sp. NIES-68]